MLHRDIAWKTGGIWFVRSSSAGLTWRMQGITDRRHETPFNAVAACRHSITGCEFCRRGERLAAFQPGNPPLVERGPWFRRNDVTRDMESQPGWISPGHKYQQSFLFGVPAAERHGERCSNTDMSGWRAPISGDGPRRLDGGRAA